ncbi:hypothetical protein ONS96_005987 [Cadophora gregata f. sp. sojae]|nr:hypothetical protein ONS96_005987 [Cadophora gregata f. sp. sojae]
MSLSTPSLSRKSSPQQYLITSPSSLSSTSLFNLSQRELSKRLPASTFYRATFSIYIRWLEVHRCKPSARTEHWSNTVMHWCHSLASKGFSVKEVVEEVESWKRANGPFGGNTYRSPPSKEEIRKAFQEDPKAQWEKRPEREGDKDREKDSEQERMGDSYRPESSSRRDNTMREWDRRVEDEWRAERDSRREIREESRLEGSGARHDAELKKFEGKPPPNYICNRCHVPGHHLQVCPTNLDPSYDRAPDDNYLCEICRKRGKHFKSLCPENTDPFSIFQKRRARGVTTPANQLSTRRDERENQSRARRERERDRHEGRLIGRLTENSSNSSATNTPTSGRKKDLIDKVQEIEDKKQRLFREQSDEIGDMIRENTAQRSSGRKRDHQENEAILIDSPTSNTIQAKKKARREGENSSTASQHTESYERFETEHRHNIEEFERGSDTDMQNHADYSSHHSRKSTPSVGFGLRPIGMSPGSMISDNESSDSMDIDELISCPHKEYSPFVQKLMRKHPEMNEVVNVIRKRKTAREMWKEADKVRRQQPRAGSPSEREFGRLTPVAYDADMTMQFDGACDDFDYDQTRDQKMTSVDTDIFFDSRTHLISTISPSRTSNIPQSEEVTMTSTNTSTNSEGPLPYTSVVVTTRETQPPEEPTDDRVVPTEQFRGYAAQQRRNIEAVRISRAGRPIDRHELKAFSANFKLATQPPKDLVHTLAKVSKNQKENEEHSKRNAAGARKWTAGSDAGYDAGSEAEIEKK